VIEDGIVGIVLYVVSLRPATTGVFLMQAIYVLAANTTGTQLTPTSLTKTQSPGLDAATLFGDKIPFDNICSDCARQEVDAHAWGEPTAIRLGAHQFQILTSADTSVGFNPSVANTHRHEVWNVCTNCNESRLATTETHIMGSWSAWRVGGTANRRACNRDRWCVIPGCGAVQTQAMPMVEHPLHDANSHTFNINGRCIRCNTHFAEMT